MEDQGPSQPSLPILRRSQESEGNKCHRRILFSCSFYELKSIMLGNCSEMTPFVGPCRISPEELKKWQPFWENPLATIACRHWLGTWHLKICRGTTPSTKRTAKPTEDSTKTEDLCAKVNGTLLIARPLGVNGNSCGIAHRFSEHLNTLNSLYLYGSLLNVCYLPCRKWRNRWDGGLEEAFQSGVKPPPRRMDRSQSSWHWTLVRWRTLVPAEVGAPFLRVNYV